MVGLAWEMVFGLVLGLVLGISRWSAKKSYVFNPCVAAMLLALLICSLVGTRPPTANSSKGSFGRASLSFAGLSSCWAKNLAWHFFKWRWKEESRAFWPHTWHVRALGAGIEVSPLLCARLLSLKRSTFTLLDYAAESWNKRVKDVLEMRMSWVSVKTLLWYMKINELVT